MPESSGLDLDAINAVLRSVDLNGDGELQETELVQLLSTPPPPDPSCRPHIVLNFDLNQTVVMVDGAIGASVDKILNMVISNCAWGRLTEADEGGEPSWQLVSEEPSLVSPEEGLKTYTQVRGVGVARLGLIPPFGSRIGWW